MKKKFFSVLLIGLCTIVSSVKAEVEFSYEAGAEVVSSYLWRGLYNGGLSFQPNVTVGFEGEHMNFSVGAWGSLGASDWHLVGKQDGYRATFLPEVDVLASFSIYGLSVGFTHYYYFQGSKFFCWDKLEAWQDDDFLENNTSTTEVQLGFNFEEILQENHNLYVNWYTMVAGNDFVYDELSGKPTKRAFSSYLELGYDYTIDAIGLTLGAQVGIVPWASDYYGNEKAAVKCLSLKIDKEWEFDALSLNLFAQGMIDPDGIDKDNLIVKPFDGKIGGQKLNGCIGLGIWF